MYQLKNDGYEGGDEYLERLLPYWSKYQEEWDEEMWDQYHYYRGVDLENSQLNPNTSVINEDYKKSYNRLETNNFNNYEEGHNSGNDKSIF